MKFNIEFIYTIDIQDCKLNTFLSYTAVGVGTETALLILRSPERIAAAVLAGTLGLLKALLGYIIFGALGGLLGSLTLRALGQAGFFEYIREKK